MTSARRGSLVVALWAGLSGAALGQDTPMSAIDWLSESLETQTSASQAPDVIRNEPPVTGGVVAAVEVAPLGLSDFGAIGLLSPQRTGLPADFWGDSNPKDITRKIADERPDMLPALQALLQKILLAELDPPALGGSEDVFLARVDKLLEMGALDQAYALLERAGPLSPEIVRRWFDVALLIDQENALCDIMQKSPDLSPTYTARVFCMARAEDWDGAVLMLNNARALGLVSEDEDALLARFLDPELFEGEPPLPVPDPLTPLTFRLFEAIGEPIGTRGLPLAFAQSDLRASTGWKAQLAAGERLARTGAVSDNQLLGLYTSRRAAGSGGVWDRVDAVQALEKALAAQDKALVAEAIVPLWRELSLAEVEVPISHIHGASLARMRLPGKAGEIAFQMGLLTQDYEIIARDYPAPSPLNTFMAGLAAGLPEAADAPNEAALAVSEGFSQARPPERLAQMIDSNRLGEAILSALTLFTTGTRGDLDEVTDAIALLRAVGLEDTARRAALEYLILDRRG